MCFSTLGPVWTLVQALRCAGRKFKGAGCFLQTNLKTNVPGKWQKESQRQVWNKSNEVSRSTLAHSGSASQSNASSKSWRQPHPRVYPMSSCPVPSLPEATHRAKAGSCCTHISGGLFPVCVSFNVLLPAVGRFSLSSHLFEAEVWSRSISTCSGLPGSHGTPDKLLVLFPFHWTLQFLSRVSLAQRVFRRFLAWLVIGYMLFPRALICFIWISSVL